MKKLIIAGTCIVLVIIGIVLVLGVLNLGPIIKTAVNTYGPEIVKTRVSVADVDISVFSAQAQLKKFILGNPEGFISPQAVFVESVSMDVDESSFIKDTIVIDRIEVSSPEITYEIKGKTDNFRTIMERIKKPGASEKTSEQKTTAGKRAKKLLIRDFIIKGGRVNVSVSMLKGEVVAASLPEIHLQNIGQGDKGASPEEVFLQIFQAVYGKITSPELTGEFAKQLKDLGLNFDGRDIREQIKGTKDKLKDVKTEIKGVREQLKGLFHE